MVEGVILLSYTTINTKTLEPKQLLVRPEGNNYGATYSR